MAGPHRALADTRNAVESAFRDAGVDAGSRVLLAVSGGSDSMALAQAALFVASRAGVPAASTVPGAPDVRALRPFLGLRRSLLREALASEGVGWVEDPTNGPDSPVRAADGTPLRRAAVRHHSLPALEEDLGPGVVEALARTAALLRADTEALDSIACEHATRLGSEPDVDGLRSLPQAVRTRILRSAALAAGARPGELTSWHIIRLDGLVASRRSGACLHLPGVGVELSAGRVIFDSAGARRRKEGRGRA